MKEIILDTLIDLLKLLPFLFITFLLMEYFEHKLNKKSKKIVEKSGKYGPIIGSLLGIVPQCGFGVMATNLYSARIISVGTLISIYLSTSDEMLPILLSNKVSSSLIFKILLIKILVGIISGVIIDQIYKKKKYEKSLSVCEEKHCDCEHGIIKSTLKHTLNISLFIFILSLLLNTAFFYLGEKWVSNIFLKGSILSPFISSILGLIPNCAASVLITELFLKGTITFGAMMSGLLTGAGVAIMVLFRQNKNIKENLKILAYVYFIGVFIGVLIDTISLLW